MGVKRTSVPGRGMRLGIPRSACTKEFLSACYGICMANKEISPIELPTNLNDYFYPNSVKKSSLQNSQADYQYPAILGLLIFFDF